MKSPLTTTERARIAAGPFCVRTQRQKHTLTPCAFHSTLSQNHKSQNHKKKIQMAI